MASQDHPNVTSPRRTDHPTTTSQDYQYTLLTPNTEGINSDVVRAVEATEQKLDEATRSMGIKDADGGGTYAPNFVRKLFPNRSSSKDTLPDERSKKDKKKGGKAIARELRALLSPSTASKKKKGGEPQQPRLSRSGDDGWSRQGPTVAKIPSKEATLNLLGKETNPPTHEEALAQQQSHPTIDPMPSPPKTSDDTRNTPGQEPKKAEQGSSMTAEPSQATADPVEPSLSNQDAASLSQASSTTSTVLHSNGTNDSTDKGNQDQEFAMSLADVEAYEKAHGYQYESIEPQETAQDSTPQDGTTPQVDVHSTSSPVDPFLGGLMNQLSQNLAGYEDHSADGLSPPRKINDPRALVPSVGPEGRHRRQRGGHDSLRVSSCWEGVPSHRDPKQRDTY